MKKEVNFISEFKEIMKENGAGFISKHLIEKAQDGFIHRIAESNEPVLITGPTGVGKDILARSIYDLSSRKNKPLTSVNCGALNEETLLSELFGHVRGAYTGAVTDKDGAIKSAHEGTLFLDEICDMSLKAQVALLRFLQSGEYNKFGEYGKTHKADVRIIAATNKNLETEIKKGSFREDLFYRINTFTISIPSIAPLNKERLEKALILLLPKIAKNFSYKLNLPYLSNAAFKILLEYGYPGNYREFESILKYALVKSNGNTINLEHLPDYITTGQVSVSQSKDNEISPLPPAEFFPAINKMIYDKLCAVHKEKGNVLQASLAFKMDSGRFNRMLKNSKEGKAI